MFEEPVQTKIRIPPLREKLVDRPRLARRLGDGSNCKVTLIRAPAGYGKTTLLSSWASDSSCNIAWFSADIEDNDPLIFWSYLASAICNTCPEIGVSTLKMLHAPSGLPVRAIVKTLVNDLLDKGQPLVLILDDYHIIDSESVHDSLRFFLEYMPESTRMVIASRRELPFSTSRLKIKGQLHEIGMEDLRFTAAEAASFTRQVMGKRLADDEISTLAAACEGWPAGLQIAALAGGRIRTDNPDALMQMKEHIAEYFMDEVFSFQPPYIQSFLLDTSILSRMNAPLCDAVTGRGDSATLLEELCRANMFVIPLDKKPYWYRYHHFFSETLRARLRQERPERVPMLHGRAANWYRNNRMPNEAIHHAVAAKNWDLAGELISRYAGVAILRGDLDTALRWIRALPKNRVAENPFLSISYAWALFLTHLSRFQSMPFHAIEHLLSDVEKFYPDETEAREENTVYQLLSPHVDAIRVHLAYSRNEPSGRVIELGKKTLEKFDDSKSNTLIRTNTLFTLALVHLDTGDLQACSACLEEARSAAFIGEFRFQVVLADSFRIFLARIRGCLQNAEQICESGMQSVRDAFLETRRIAPEMLSYYDMHRAQILYERNRMEEAGTLFEKAMPSVSLLGETYIILFSYELMFYLRLFTGEKERDVLHPLRKMEKLSVYCPRARSLSGALRIRYLLCRFGGFPDSIRRAFAVAEENGVLLKEAKTGDRRYPVPFEHKIRMTEKLSLIRLHIAEWRIRGEHRARISMTDILDTIAGLLFEIRRLGMGEAEIEALVLYALARDLQGEDDVARKLLKQAIGLAGPEGSMRVFVNEGEPMASLLEKAVYAGECVDYARKLLDAIRGAGSAPPSVDAAPDPHASVPPPAVSMQAAENPLSRQERAVLGHIARGLSNQEIASELCIAVTTVKTHNYNIYKKLGVSSRMAAINKYRESVVHSKI